MKTIEEDSTRQLEETLARQLKKSPTVQLKKYLELDQDTQQEIIFIVLRTWLLQLPDLDDEAHEYFLTLWLRCIEWGMEDVLVGPVLQTIMKLDESNSSIPVGESIRNPAFLIEQIDERLARDRVFWRIFSLNFFKLHWKSLVKVYKGDDESRLVSHKHKQPRTSQSHSLVDSGDLRIVSHLFKLALAMIDNVDATRGILSFLHQFFLENSTIIVFTFQQDLFPIPLYRHLLTFVPSLHVLLEPTWQCVSQSNIDGKLHYLRWAVLFANQYPMPRTLELVELVLTRCEQLTDTAITSLAVKIVVNALQAFPIIMPRAAPLLVKWMGSRPNDFEFIASATRAAQQIAAINQAVTAPIYKRPPLISSSLS